MSLFFGQQRSLFNDVHGGKNERKREREREKKEEKKRTQRDNEMSVSSRPEPVGRTSGRYADYSHHSQNRSLATRLLEAGSI